MADFILLMHDDAEREAPAEMWDAYFEKLNRAGVFEGGSSIGPGECMRKAGAPGAASPHLVGFIRVEAEDLAAAKRLVQGNPVYESGGTVEVRALPKE